MHTYICTNIHLFVSTDICSCACVLYVCIDVGMYVNRHTQMHEYIHEYIQTHVYAYMLGLMHV